MHSCQELIDNKPGCEWFGLDMMVDDDYNVWLLENNSRSVCLGLHERSSTCVHAN